LICFGNVCSRGQPFEPLPRLLINRLATPIGRSRWLDLRLGGDGHALGNVGRRRASLRNASGGAQHSAAFPVHSPCLAPPFCGLKQWRRQEQGSRHRAEGDWLSRWAIRECQRGRKASEPRSNRGSATHERPCPPPAQGPTGSQRRVRPWCRLIESQIMCATHPCYALWQIQLSSGSCDSSVGKGAP